jgi:hypothetical protein
MAAGDTIQSSPLNRRALQPYQGALTTLPFHQSAIYTDFHKW